MNVGDMIQIATQNELNQVKTDIGEKIGETDDPSGTAATGTVTGKLNKIIKDTEDLASVKSDVTGIGGKVETVGEKLNYKLYVGTSFYRCMAEGIYRKMASSSYTNQLMDTRIYFRGDKKLYSLRQATSEGVLPVRVYDSGNYSTRTYEFPGTSGNAIGTCAVIGNTMYAFLRANEVYKCDFTTMTSTKITLSASYENINFTYNRCFVYNNKIYIVGKGVFEYNPTNNAVAKKSETEVYKSNISYNSAYLQGSNIYLYYGAEESYIYHITSNTVERIVLPEEVKAFTNAVRIGDFIYYTISDSTNLYRSRVDYTDFRQMKSIPCGGGRILASFGDNKLHLISTPDAGWYAADVDSLIEGRSKIYLKAGNRVYTDGKLLNSTGTVVSNQTAPSEGVYYLDDYSYYTVE